MSVGTMTETVTVYGWEVHFKGGTSDKFYRMLFFQSGEGRWTALAHYGKRNQAGQFKAYNAMSQNAALRIAQDKTNEKEAKHYVPTRDLTSFEVGAADAFSVVYGDSVNSEKARGLVGSFIAAARSAGNEKIGASL